MKEIIAEEKVLFVGQLEYTAHTGAVCCCINDDVSRYSVIISSDGLPARSDTTLLPNLYFLFNILVFTFFFSFSFCWLVGWWLEVPSCLMNSQSHCRPVFFLLKNSIPPHFPFWLLSTFYTTPVRSSSSSTMFSYLITQIRSSWRSSAATTTAISDGVIELTYHHTDSHSWDERKRRGRLFNCSPTWALVYMLYSLSTISS